MTIRRPISIEEQVAKMKAIWPRFAVHNLDRARQIARWTGTVEPQFARYKLEVRFALTHYPEVRVLEPALVRLPGNVEGALPHVYPPADDPTLCLFDPEAGQWNWSMAIAETTLPWACDWITCYEFWLITGIWRGGGRHAGDPPIEQRGTP
jgi:hypothetical protein